MASIIVDESNKRAIIHISAQLDVKEVLPMLEHVLEIRKHYANMCVSSDEFEPRHREGLNGFNFCNEEIKKLIGII